MKTKQEEEDTEWKIRTFRFQNTTEKVNMIISINKTQIRTISEDPTRYKLAANNQRNGEVINFKYLGVNMRRNRNPREGVKAQTNRLAMIWIPERQTYGGISI